MARGFSTLKKTAEDENPVPSRTMRWCAVVFLGIGAGFCNGLLGAAGGVLIVLLLPRLTLPDYAEVRAGEMRTLRPFDEQLSRRDLLALSMAVMMPISGVSGVIYWLSGIRPEVQTVAWLIIPSVVGGLIGARLLGRLPETLLRRLFSILLVISGVRMVF